MSYNGAHVQALYWAAQNGGWISMKIRDVRTGYIVRHGTSLF